jgi:hypothetical protein
MPRVTGKPGRGWPWLVLAIIIVAVAVFIALWATGTIY